MCHRIRQGGRRRRTPSFIYIDYCDVTEQSEEDNERRGRCNCAITILYLRREDIITLQHYIKQIARERWGDREEDTLLARI